MQLEGVEIAMPDVLMYTKNICPYCDRAKSLLKSKGVTWKEINLERQPEHIAAMIQRSEGRRTVPQIFVDGVGLGGFDDIAALDRQGKLDGILGLNR
jgi:glutaredoxin 3